MFKVIAIAMLVITVIGAAGVAVYDSSKPDQSQARKSLAVTPTAATTPVPVARNTNPNRQGSDLGTLPQQQTPEVGQPWAASGAVASVDDFGFELTVDGSSEIIYVELGPTAFWQAQGIALSAGERVTVVGFAQDGLYHAAVVSKMDGGQLTVRDATSGQPLWSGGVIGGQDNGNQTPQTQVSAADWFTIEGVVTAVAQNSLTIETTEAASLTLQLGRPGFAAEQGVNFAIGDQVRVIGYDNVGQLRAGEIDNLTQGGRLMLLDPNGRPLWAGSGTAGGQSQGGQGQGGQGGQGQGGQGGQGQGGQGQGYRGGRTN
jgi:hypothetical protein